VSILNPDTTLTFKTEKRKFENVRLAVIDWRDSSGHSSRWERVDDILDQSSRAGRCVSVGWVLHDDKDAIVLIPHLAEISGIAGGIDGSSGITIPRECVVKIIYLTRSYKNK
jgi:hypothetical protein